MFQILITADASIYNKKQQEEYKPDGSGYHDLYHKILQEPQYNEDYQKIQREQKPKNNDYHHEIDDEKSVSIDTTIFENLNKKKRMDACDINNKGRHKRLDKEKEEEKRKKEQQQQQELEKKAQQIFQKQMRQSVKTNDPSELAAIDKKCQNHKDDVNKALVCGHVHIGQTLFKCNIFFINRV